MSDDATPAKVRLTDGLRPSADNCSHCGFPLRRNSGGLRHYGTHTAHQENECLRLLHAEIVELRADAERYRHLRRADVDIDGCALIYCNEELDKIVDASIQAFENIDRAAMLDGAA
jgi:hypothetical protein